MKSLCKCQMCDRFDAQGVRLGTGGYMCTACFGPIRDRILDSKPEVVIQPRSIAPPPVLEEMSEMQAILNFVDKHKGSLIDIGYGFRGTESQCRILLLTGAICYLEALFKENDPQRLEDYLELMRKYIGNCLITVDYLYIDLKPFVKLTDYILYQTNFYNQDYQTSLASNGEKLPMGSVNYVYLYNSKYEKTALMKADNTFDWAGRYTEQDPVLAKKLFDTYHALRLKQAKQLEELFG